MKIHVFYPFRDTPFGGGNQFLKALKNEWIKKNVYSDSPKDADIILINSYPFEFKDKIKFYSSIYKYKQTKEIIVIHRMDGPIFRARGRDLCLDRIIYLLNSSVADGTIFQSKWSKKENYNLGYKKNLFETIIQNAPDPEIFNTKYTKKREKKIQIIATSWSDNINKGFDIYQYIDLNLDFNKYNMTFVGNSPIVFKNIKHVPPLSSKNLAKLLCEHDLFITASGIEACSNSLIESLHCGLPSVYKIGSSNGELVKKAGEGFNGKDDVIETIERVSSNLEGYQSQIHPKTITEIADEYYTFCQKIYSLYLNDGYKIKKFSRLDLYKILLYTYGRNIKEYSNYAIILMQSFLLKKLDF